VEGKTEEMRQLCSHPQISDKNCRVLGGEAKSLTDIYAAVISHKRQQITETKVQLVRLPIEIKGLRERVAALAAKELLFPLPQHDQDRRR